MSRCTFCTDNEGLGIYFTYSVVKRQTMKFWNEHNLIVKVHRKCDNPVRILRCVYDIRWHSSTVGADCWGSQQEMQPQNQWRAAYSHISHPAVHKPSSRCYECNWSNLHRETARQLAALNRAGKGAKDGEWAQRNRRTMHRPKVSLSPIITVMRGTLRSAAKEDRVQQMDVLSFENCR